MRRPTYSEIFEERHGNDKSLEDLCLTPAEATAWAILEFFTDRKGFDHWWNSDVEEDEISDEIFAHLVKVIEKNFVCSPRK